MKQLEYHTFLHHSQTATLILVFVFGLSTIHFYIILKQKSLHYLLKNRLSTIHFYIILKQTAAVNGIYIGLSTIHFYIILKQAFETKNVISAWVPYIFTSFSNTQHLIYISSLAWVPYIFTSFSNHLLFTKHFPGSLSTIHFYIILKLTPSL